MTGSDEDGASAPESAAADSASAAAPASASDDVVVVGGGLGGYAAALAAARERSGASVRLLVTETDQFERESGLIDVLGAVGEGREPVSDPLSAIEGLPDDHLYSSLGVETVRSALARFDEATGDHYCGDDTDRNALLPTAVGRLQPAARYPASMKHGLAGAGEPMRLVGFDRVPDFDAALSTNRLREAVATDVEYSTIKTPYKVEEPPVTRKIASALDQNPTNEEGTTARKSLANELRSVLDVEPRVGVPAVLGLDDAETVREELESLLQARLFEVPLGPPSIPGGRLESALTSALQDHGVHVEREVSVTGVDAGDETVEELTISRADGDDLSRAASSFVLATGGVGAGGIESDRTGMREPLFDCAVAAPAETGEWVAQAFLGDHRAIRAGVSVDEDLRPAQASGDGSFENLYAAGRVIAGPNVVAERSAAGIALATGEVAGRRAVE